ncbi:MAG TPA: ribose-phosphate pyrophosphokinase [Vicinamibacterales bacterium]|jgi:ribose-phosphate pyrophosphokinase|nr:ribose-phosphate pyrophosphokinase [Vicinamibacterales bacterium]
MKTLLLTWPGNEPLGVSLLAALDAEPVAFSTRSFPDGETFLRIDTDVRQRTVCVLCTLRDPDARFLPLAFAGDTVRELGARSVGLVAPYLAYMRQDRRFEPGEALTSTYFARLLSSRFDWLVTIDPHLHRRKSLAEIYSIPAAVAHAAPLLANWVRDNVPDALLVGPDAESEQWVRAVAEAVPCPHVVLEKIRRGDRDVSVSSMPDERLRAGRTAILIDDIISSARTMIETVRQWTAAGLPAPVCLAVHGVFAARAYDELRAAGAARIVTTNSIPHASNGIDVGGLLAEPVRRAMEGSLESRPVGVGA